MMVVKEAGMSKDFLDNPVDLELKKLTFTPKQARYWVEANKKYNVKVGAAGVGKTFMDIYMIPARLLATSDDPKSKRVIIGHTMSTVIRNVIEPMRNIFGEHLVSNVSSNGYCVIFGKVVHIFGAEKVSAKAKIQGQDIEYAYGDEVATWNEEFFNMFLSRLRLDNSTFDGTCNPEHPEHWFKEFIDRMMEKGDEMYHQHYVIDDGVLSEEVKASQKAALSGVDYQRLVLGKWARAEGLIYDRFTENPDDYLVDSSEIPPLRKITIGVDFGQSKSKHAFVATGISDNFDVYVLETEQFDPTIASEMGERYVAFLKRVEDKYNKKVAYTYGDSARTTDVTQLEVALSRAGIGRFIAGTNKRRILDRITATNQLIGTRRLWYTENALDLRDSFMGATWDPKKADSRLDENTDILDAFEYSIQEDIDILLRK